MDLMSPRLAWSTKQAPEQPKLHRENLSQNQTKPNQSNVVCSSSSSSRQILVKEPTPSLRERDAGWDALSSEKVTVEA